MSEFRISKMHFSTKNLVEEMKLTKIKGTFLCEDERAREILDIINNDGVIEVPKHIKDRFYTFGISANIQSLERLREIEEEKKRKKEFDERWDKSIPLADEWYKTLSEEQQFYVMILSRKFTASAG